MGGRDCARSDIRVALPGWMSCDGLGLPLSISRMGPWGRCLRLEPCPGLGRQDVSAAGGARASFLLPCAATWRPAEAREREEQREPQTQQQRQETPSLIFQGGGAHQKQGCLRGVNRGAWPMGQLCPLRANPTPRMALWLTILEETNGGNLTPSSPAVNARWKTRVSCPGSPGFWSLFCNEQAGTTVPRWRQ